MTATIPEGCIVCPRCKGEGFLPVRQYPTCGDCNGKGHILDPRISIYYGSAPAAIVAMLRESGQADEVKLRKFQMACRAFEREVTGNQNLYQTSPDGGVVSNIEQRLFPLAARADFIRCIFCPPWLSRTCPECEGHWKKRGQGSCAFCNQGTLPGLEIDPRWCSTTVMDLTRTIRGIPKCSYCGKETCEHVHKRTEVAGAPLFERMPFLADELEIAGCDCEPLLAHCREEHHVAGACWVIRAILGA